ncbi:MAG: orotidine 5'-phosphate decarboxylase, partial [Candidatus Omnitrophica bacterium]|nr:orotidine 5'-phosphate decarboxylase [Candidatus Omnitrophota bacterium]
DIFKVGSQLFTACGPAAVRFIQEKGKEVFLDLKYHDIPNTVSNAVQAAVKSLAVGGKDKRSILMYTMHIVGGEEMLKSAVQAAKKTAQGCGLRVPLSLGITVLISEQRSNGTNEIV